MGPRKRSPDVLLLGSVLAVFLCFWVPLELSRRYGRVRATHLLGKLRVTRDMAVLRTEDARIAIGYNVCLDAVVNVFELFENAGIEEPDSAADHKSFETLEELAATFLLHFSKAAGGERSVKNPAAFQEIEKALYSTRHRQVLGGNAAIMAHVLSHDHGFQHVLLGGQVGPNVKRLLPDRMDTVGMPTGNVRLGDEDVRVRQDEVHIIMEYEKGQFWGKSSAERANRFIISHDQSNAVLAAMEKLNEHVANAEPGFDVLIASGFHMLDAKSAQFRKLRLQAAKESLQRIPASTRVHLELASIGDEALLQQLVQSLFPEVDSIGLNEQELGDLFVALKLDKKHSKIQIELVKQTLPDVSTVAKVLNAILAEFGPQKGSNRGIARIHFHSFAFHIIAQASSTKNDWPHIAQAVAAGSIMASERACNRTTLADHHISLHMNPSFSTESGTEMQVTLEEPTPHWTSADGFFDFVLAPVLACNKAVQTVGLGDSISSSAIAYQI